MKVVARWDEFAGHEGWYVEIRDEGHEVVSHSEQYAWDGPELGDLGPSQGGKVQRRLEERFSRFAVEVRS